MSIDEREQARHRQEVLGAYRAWAAYLEARQALADLAGGAEADPFEGPSAAQERRDAAQRRVDGLAAERRELFDWVVEQERQAVQRRLDAQAPVRNGTLRRADADEVLRQALATLVDLARGRQRDDGRGMLPRGKPGALRWLAIDRAELEDAPPSEVDYEVASGPAGARRRVALNLALAAIIACAVPLVAFLLTRPSDGAPAEVAATAHGAPLEIWPIVALADPAGAWRLPVAPTTRKWPPHDPGQARWLRGAGRPIRLCLPPERLDGLAALLVEAAGVAPARIFDLADGPAAGADLELHACDADGQEPPALYGRLRALEPIPLRSPDEPAPDGYRVTAIRAVGRGEDPTIPQGMARILVTVAGGGAVDWLALAPTLLLPSGATATASGREPAGAEDTITFRYIVPDQPGRRDVVWQVAAGAHQAVRYRAALEPPPTRDELLRGSLRVGDPVVTASRQTMAVRLSLQNAGPAPLAILPDDLRFQARAGEAPAAAPALRQPLAPGERRPVVIELPLQDGVLQLGPFRYQIAVEGG